MKNIIKKSLFTVLAIAAIGIACFAFIVGQHVTASAEQTKQKLNANASVQVVAETEDLGFTAINGGTEYRVRAVNKQMTEVKIPTTYDGKPVTEIATNGFMSCRNLKNVYIPSTVKVLGTNAFYGCTVLEQVWGGASLESIGNSAFANCTALQYFRIPKTIDTLGSTIFRNNPNDIYVRMYEEELSVMSTVSSTWSNGRAEGSEIIYGEDMVCKPIDESDYSKGFLLMYPNEKKDNEILDRDGDYEFVCSYSPDRDGNGPKYPVVGINAYAFEFKSFNSLTVKYDPDIAGGFTVSLGDGVFENTKCETIKIEVNVEFFDLMAEQDSFGHFTDSTVNEIVLPDNITEIPFNCFVGCDSLTTIVIPSNVKYIGDFAFSDCTAIERIDIPNTVKYMGEGVFTNWGNVIEQTISFDAVKPPISTDDYVPWYDGIILDNVQILYKTVTVELDSAGGTGGTESVEAMYGRKLPEAEAPQPPSEYVTFGGYYSDFDGNGEMYYDGNMTPKEEVWGDEEIGDENNEGIRTLHAWWQGNQYNVSFERDGGIGGCNDVDVRYGELFRDFDVTQAPEKFGYNFTGYYTEGEGNGVMIYDANMKASEVIKYDASFNTLYAAWSPKKYEVSFDADGGTGGTAHVYIVYMTKNLYLPEDQIIPHIETPVKQHYTFMGFYMNGVQYFSEDGECVHDWDMTAATLTAKWEAIQYKITYVDYPIDRDPSFVTFDDIEKSEEGYVYSEEKTEIKDGIKKIWAPIKLDINNFYCAEVYFKTVEATLGECYDGTSGTYKIWYCSQFEGIRNHVNSMTNTIIKQYELMADIDIAPKKVSLGEPESWIPLPRFAGSFNGHSHTISGLYINATAAVTGYYGLFFSNSGTISRLNVEGSITLTGSGEIYAGLLCGRNTGRIENCRTSSDNAYGITCDISTSYVGGAVGYNSGTLYYVYSTAGISGCGNIGGVVGRNVGEKDTSYITGASYSGNILYNCAFSTSVGGIAGVMEGGTIEVCATAGMVTVNGISANQKWYQPCIGTVIGTAYPVYVICGTHMTQMGIDTSRTNALKTYIGGNIGHEIFTAPPLRF